MRADPRVKILFILCLSTLAVLALDIVYLGIVFITAFIIDLLLKVNIIQAFKKVKHLLSLIIFIALMQSLTVREGVALIKIGSFTIVTTGGLLNGAEFAVRMSIIIFSSLIAATSDSREMTDALIKLKVPYEIAFMTSVAIRFLPMFRDEFSSRLNAIAMRGLDVKKLKLRKKLKVYSYMLAPTVSGSIIKSRDLANSMISRGFRAYDKRTMLRVLKLHASDYMLILLSAAYLGGFLYFMYTYGGIL
jgi:energy-coupling factor transport system permease protein